MIPPNGIQDVNGNDIAWESCVTMNNHWGYCANDHFFKPAPMLIKKLVECVSKGGNLLLNVGPDYLAAFPRPPRKFCAAWAGYSGAKRLGGGAFRVAPEKAFKIRRKTCARKRYF